MRDDQWLEVRLNTIWRKYFSDIKKLNTVKIHFGRKAKKRLASIRQLSKHDKHSDTEIKVTAYFKELQVPEYIVDVTIAHELCHYAHGFASPLPKFSQFPHRGSLVDNELKKRGLGEMLEKQEKWLKEDWKLIIKDDLRVKRRRRRRSRPKSVFSLLRKLVFIN